MSGDGDDLFGGGDREDGQDHGGGGGDMGGLDHGGGGGDAGGLDGLLASLQARAGRRTARHGTAVLPEELVNGRAADGGESAAAGPGDRIVKIADTVR